VLTQKIAVSYASKLVIQLFQIIGGIIVARIVGPSVLGTVAFGLSFVSMFAFIADLGIGTAHIKLVSQGEDLGRCVTTFMCLKTACVGVFVTVVAGFFLAQKYLLKAHFEGDGHNVVILVFLLSAAIGQLLSVAKTSFAARTEQAKQDLPDLLRVAISQGLRVAVVLLGYRATAIALGELTSIVVTAPVIIAMFWRYPRGSYDKGLANKYIRISGFVLIIGMATNIVYYLDKVALQYLWNSEEVGIYSAGYRIGDLVIMMGNSVGLLLFPLFSRAAANKDFEDIKEKIDKYEHFTLIFIMPVVVLLSLYADPIIRILLGSQYIRSIPVMVIINIASFVMILNVPYGNVITGMGFFRLAAWINVLNLLFFVAMVGVVANPWFLNLGAKGMAICVLASNIFIGSLYRIYGRRKCERLKDLKSYKYVVFGILNYIGFYILYSWLSGVNAIIGRIAFIPIYFGFTFFTLVVLGWARKEDVKGLLEVMNVRKASAYVRKEIFGGERG
jgi:O-antigen/teichoic acid export membrane protein